MYLYDIPVRWTVTNLESRMMNRESWESRIGNQKLWIGTRFLEGRRGKGEGREGRWRREREGRERWWWCRDCGIGTRDSGLEVTNLWDRVGEGGGGGRGWCRRGRIARFAAIGVAEWSDRGNSVAEGSGFPVTDTRFLATSLCGAASS